MNKTNALRILDQKKISYEAIEYDNTLTDGESIAAVLNEKCECVFKTLVTQANTREYLVFVLPVNKALDLKKAAAVAGVKNVEMIKQKDLLPLTGYIHGGCSPVGMKKVFATVFDSSVLNQEKIVFSAGKIGFFAEVAVKDLEKIVKYSVADVTAERQ